MNNEKTTGVHLWLVMWKASNAVKEFDARSIEKLGMCFSDFVIMEILLHKGPLPVNTLGKKVDLTSGSITTAIDRLEELGYAERKAHAADRRVTLVRLTERGRRFIEKGYARHAERMEQAISSVLKPEERATLIRLMKKLGKSVEARL